MTLHSPLTLTRRRQDSGAPGAIVPPGLTRADDDDGDEEYEYSTLDRFLIVCAVTTALGQAVAAACSAFEALCRLVTLPDEEEEDDDSSS